MDIQYYVQQTCGCHIVMPVFSAEAADSFPARRVTAMNEFYTSMTEHISTYAAGLYAEFPHSRYTCLGEVSREENGCLTVQFRLFRRTPGQPSTSRILRHIWQDGLLLRQIVDR